MILTEQQQNGDNKKKIYRYKKKPKYTKNVNSMN